MKYVRCINNRKYFYFPEESRHQNDTILGLEIGQVYKLALSDPNDQPEELRVIDGTGEDYIYPASYFEPFLPNNEKAEGVTVYLHP